MFSVLYLHLLYISYYKIICYFSYYFTTGLVLYVRTGYNRRTAQTSCVQPATTTEPDSGDVTPQPQAQNPIDAFADFVRAALKNMGSEQRHKATMKILQALHDAESVN